MRAQAGENFKFDLFLSSIITYPNKRVVLVLGVSPVPGSPRANFQLNFISPFFNNFSLFYYTEGMVADLRTR